MNQQIKTSLGAIVLIIIAFTAGLFIWQYEKNQPIDETQISQPLRKNKPTNPIICTEEGKACPDGSFVSRTGPNCEFAPCSNTQIVGGPCSYDKVPGTCKIISVTQDDNVKFTFTAIDPLSASDLAKNLNGQHSDTQYIFNAENLPIKSGDITNCEANLINKGTCTPMIFRLTGMNGWQVYTNKKYEFSFQYPTEYVLTEKENKITILTKENYDFRARTGADYYPEDIIINIKPVAKNFSLGNDLINFAGGKAAESISRTSGDSGDVSTYYSLTTIRNELIYDITFNNQPDLSAINKKILSTFKFTK